MEQDQIQVNITDLLREQSSISSRIHNLEIQIWNLKEEIQNLTNREDEIEDLLKPTKRGIEIPLEYVDLVEDLIDKVCTELKEKT